MSALPMPPAWMVEQLRAGLVIPAHPLALTSSRRLDERRQRALTRYYHAAGAGGVAVGVHTTQFEIREPQHALFEPVLKLAVETVRACDAATGRQTVLVAGVCGDTPQAVREAALARDLGYHAGLLSLAALRTADDARLLEHCRVVAREIPLFGFYLQPAVGGRLLSRDFWRTFAEIPNVVAIKVAPFNRYQTLDVVRGLFDARRENDIALYTGNDDTIVADLLTPYVLPRGSETVTVRFAGGLLGHWACGTRRAVELLHECHAAVRSGTIPTRLLTLAAQVTDSNAALFDAAHNFAGCIPGIHEMLRRNGLLENTLCLDPHIALSPGQADEIERIRTAYPHLTDTPFIAVHRDTWLA